MYGGNAGRTLQVGQAQARHAEGVFEQLAVGAAQVRPGCRPCRRQARRPASGRAHRRTSRSPSSSRPCLNSDQPCMYSARPWYGLPSCAAQHRGVGLLGLGVVAQAEQHLAAAELGLVAVGGLRVLAPPAGRAWPAPLRAGRPARAPAPAGRARGRCPGPAGRPSGSPRSAPSPRGSPARRSGRPRRRRCACRHCPFPGRPGGASLRPLRRLGRHFEELAIGGDGLVLAGLHAAVRRDLHFAAGQASSSVGALSGVPFLLAQAHSNSVRHSALGLLRIARPRGSPGWRGRRAGPRQSAPAWHRPPGAASAAAVRRPPAPARPLCCSRANATARGVSAWMRCSSCGDARREGLEARRLVALGLRQRRARAGRAAVDLRVDGLQRLARLVQALRVLLRQLPGHRTAGQAQRARWRRPVGRRRRSAASVARTLARRASSSRLPGVEEGGAVGWRQRPAPARRSARRGAAAVPPGRRAAASWRAPAADVRQRPCAGWRACRRRRPGCRPSPAGCASGTAGRGSS